MESDAPWVDLGGRLREARENYLGLSTHGAAERLGVNQSTVWKWEQGVRPPSGAYLIGLQSESGVSAHWLMTGEGHPEDAPSSDATRKVALIRQILDAKRVADTDDVLELLNQVPGFGRAAQ